MKKFLTMLVLIALVSVFAFADTDGRISDGDAAIVIKMTVEEVKPLIQLNYSADNYTDSADGIDVGFSIKEGGKVNFQAVLMNPTRSNEKFSIAFGGGTFNDVVRRGAIGTRSPNSIRTAVGDVSGIDGIGSVTLGEAAGNGGEENKVVLIAFEGVVRDDVTFPLTLASAEYEYAEDPSIDSGVYYADVTMTVATL